MKKYDIILVDLGSVIGSEQSGMRPCLVLQNNPTNDTKINTFIVAPFSSALRSTPFGVVVKRNLENGLVLDSRLEISQLRVVSSDRVRKQLGTLEKIYVGVVRQKLIDFLDLEDEF